MKQIKILVVLLLTSCNTYQKQLSKFNQFADAHQGELAKKCVEYFPVKETSGPTQIDSVKKANNVNYKKQIDSIKTIADNLKNQLAKDTTKGNPCASVVKYYGSQVQGLTDKLKALQGAYKPCKPDTEYRTHTVYKVDEAALKVANDRFSASQDSLRLIKSELKNTQDQSTKRLHWVFYLGGALLLLVGASVLKAMGRLAI